MKRQEKRAIGPTMRPHDDEMIVHDNVLDGNRVRSANIDGNASIGSRHILLPPEKCPIDNGMGKF